MARDISPKCKQCRREGIKLHLKGARCSSPKCALVKRNYPPGIHGPKQGKPRLTGYGTQLREKQKLKRIYGILEKQLRIYFDKSIRQKGETGENLLQLLEMRLDNIIYRTGFAPSRNLARQLVNHGHFLVNNKKVNIPSFQLKQGDVITLKKSSKDYAPFRDLGKKLENEQIIDWIEVNPSELSIKIVAVPLKDDIKQPFDVNVVVEYYSR